MNATFLYDTAQYVAEFQALPPGTKMIVVAYGILAPNGCAKDQNWSQQWATTAALLGPYLNKIEAFLITDEPDLRAIDICFQDDPDFISRQMKMKNLMTEVSNIIKTTTTPGADWSQVKTWVNYGPTFRHAGVGLAQNIDWNSFDCYGPFTHCARVTIPQLVDIMAAKLPNAATEKILLVADASCFKYHDIGRKTHESELFVRALEYWQLAKTHPRVQGMVGFIWEWPFPGGHPPHAFPAPDSLHAIDGSAGLTALYRNIGLNLLTNAIPSFSRIAAPSECLIPVGSNSCSVNLSWTTTSGPNVGAFARMAGNPDIVYGPLCSGATSCSLPAGVGDYIAELREFRWDGNSRLIDAKAVKVRYGNGTPTGQITHTPAQCDADAHGNCFTALVANVQNAPSAAFFLPGSPSGFCTGWVTLCENTIQLAPGQYSFTLQLRANGLNPNSQLLDQRTFQLTVFP